MEGVSKEMLVSLQRRVVAGYLMYSLAILGNTAYLGQILSLFLHTFYCKSTISIPLLVISGLAGFSLLCQLTCWVMWQVVRGRAHAIMAEEEDKVEVKG